MSASEGMCEMGTSLRPQLGLRNAANEARSRLDCDSLSFQIHGTVRMGVRASSARGESASYKKRRENTKGKRGTIK
jgi:hypothetical protein